MWYNGNLKTVVSGGAVNTPDRIHLIGDVPMSTIPHYALQDNPQTPYTVYVLLEPDMPVEWRNVRYVGLSTNVLARYAQHLACREADSNEDKNEWIQGVLASGKLPPVHEIEKLATIEEGRAREQYWIRYAMSQGANILNRQITYIGTEREQAKIEREIRYARIGAIIEQGIFVKRRYAWYPSRLLKVLNADEGRLQLYVLYDMFFLNEQGMPCNVLKSPHEDFDTWIQKYIPVLKTNLLIWDWNDRISAINFARLFGKTPEFCDPPPQPGKKSRKRKK